MQIRSAALGWWTVEVDPGELEITATRRLPYGTTIGAINERGTISVSRPAASVPRNYNRAARAMLERARQELWDSGRLRNRPAERRRKEEQRTGQFIVRIDDGQTSRFHEVRPAMDWAEARLKSGRGQRAEFYHESGFYQYWPFQALEKNAYGHIRIGAMYGESGSLVQKAYDARNSAEHAPVHDKPEAWLVAADAFYDVGNAFQAQYANAQAKLWQKKQRVSSRDPRRDTRTRTRRRR